MHIFWDTCKAYFRSFVINFMAQKNKTRKQNYSKHTDLKTLKLKLQKDLNSQSIANLQVHLNTLLSQEITHKMKLAQQNVFKHANKVGKWLVHELHKLQDDKKINSKLKMVLSPQVVKQ